MTFSQWCELSPEFCDAMGYEMYIFHYVNDIQVTPAGELNDFDGLYICGGEL